MKKIIFLVVLCLVALVLYAANPTFNSFNTHQFAVSEPQNIVSIKSSATVTNEVDWGTFQLPSIPGGIGYFAALDASGNVTAAVPAGNSSNNVFSNFYSTNIFTTNITVQIVSNLSLTPSEPIVTDANDVEISQSYALFLDSLLAGVGNGPGVLTNTSSTSTPVLSWVPVGGGGGGGGGGAAGPFNQSQFNGTGGITNIKSGADLTNANLYTATSMGVLSYGTFGLGIGDDGFHDLSFVAPGGNFYFGTQLGFTDGLIFGNRAVLGGGLDITGGNITNVHNASASLLGRDVSGAEIIVQYSTVSNAIAAGWAAADTIVSNGVITFVNGQLTVTSNAMSALCTVVSNGCVAYADARGTIVSNGVVAWANATFGTATADGSTITNGSGVLGVNYGSGLAVVGGKLTSTAVGGVTTFGGASGAITIDTTQLLMTGQQLSASPMGLTISNAYAALANGVGAACTNLANGIGAASTNLANGIGTACTNYVNAVGTATTNGYQTFANQAGAACTNLDNARGTIYSNLFNTITAANLMGTACTNYVNAVGLLASNLFQTGSTTLSNLTSQTATMLNLGLGTNVQDTNVLVNARTNSTTLADFTSVTNLNLNFGTNHVYWVAVTNANLCISNILGLTPGLFQNWGDLYLSNANASATVTIWFAEGASAPPTGFTDLLVGYTNGVVLTNSVSPYHFQFACIGTNYAMPGLAQWTFAGYPSK